MRTLPRSIGALFMALLLLALATSPALAGEAIIKSATRLNDPGLIDVSARSVSFDAATGELSVTGLVTCYAEAVSVVVVDFSAVQAQGGRSIRSATYNDQIGCGEEFTVALPAPAEGSFKAGPAQVEVSAFACSFNCTSETLRLDVVLRP